MADDSFSDSDDTSTSSLLADTQSTEFFDSDPSVGEFQPASSNRAHLAKRTRHDEACEEFCEAKGDLTDSDFKLAKSDTSSALFDSAASDESDAADFSQAASDIYSSVASASETERVFLGEESDGQYEMPTAELAKTTRAALSAISSSESSLTTESSVSDLETSLPIPVVPVLSPPTETTRYSKPETGRTGSISTVSSLSTDSSSSSGSNVPAREPIPVLPVPAKEPIPVLPVPAPPTETITSSKPETGRTGSISTVSSLSTDSSSSSGSNVPARKSSPGQVEKYGEKIRELPPMERVSWSHSNTSSSSSQAPSKAASTTEGVQNTDERSAEDEEPGEAQGYGYAAFFRVAALANMFWTGLQKTDSSSTVSSYAQLQARETSLADILYKASLSHSRQDSDSTTTGSLRASTSDSSLGQSSASHIIAGYEATAPNLLATIMPQKSISETALSLISSVFAATNVGPLANVQNIGTGNTSSQPAGHEIGSPSTVEIMPRQSTLASTATNVVTAALKSGLDSGLHFSREASLSSSGLSSDTLSSMSFTDYAATGTISGDPNRASDARQPDPSAMLPVPTKQEAEPIQQSRHGNLPVTASSPMSSASFASPLQDSLIFGDLSPQIPEKQPGNIGVEAIGAPASTTAAVTEPPSPEKCVSFASAAPLATTSRTQPRRQSFDSLAEDGPLAAYNEVLQEGGPGGDGIAMNDQQQPAEVEYDYTSMFSVAGLLNWLWAWPDSSVPEEAAALTPEGEGNRAYNNSSEVYVDQPGVHDISPSASSSGGTFSDVSELPAEEVSSSSSIISTSSILSASSTSLERNQQKSKKKLVSWIRNVVAVKAKFRTEKPGTEPLDTESDISTSTLSSGSSSSDWPHSSTVAVAPRKGISYDSYSTLSSSVYSQSTTSEVKIQVERSDDDDASFADAVDEPASELYEPIQYGFLGLLKYIGLASLFWASPSENMPAEVSSIRTSHRGDQEDISFASAADTSTALQALRTSDARTTKSRWASSSSSLSASSTLDFTTDSSLSTLLPSRPGGKIPRKKSGGGRLAPSSPSPSASSTLDSTTDSSLPPPPPSLPGGKIPRKKSPTIADTPARDVTGNEEVKDGGAKSNTKTFAVALLSLFVCVGGVTLLTITLISDQSSLTERSRRSQKQFSSALQVEEVDHMAADWSSDLGEMKSPKAVKIIDALKPKIRSAFEAEGFTTDAVNITKIGPISVAIYDIMNNTFTSLSAVDELSLAPIYKGDDGKTIPEKDMPKPQGHRLVLRVEFETVGKPVDNTPLINQVGEAEAGKIQYMLGKHMENQGAVAMAEAVEVSKDFQKVAKATDPRHRSTRNLKIAELEQKIDCQKTGKQLAMSRALVICPEECEKAFKEGQLFGTDWYHISSPICHAAIHSYVLESGKGGEVEFMTLGESFLFTGSVRNGLKSKDLLQYGEKFMVKKPGPSWTTQITSTTELMPTTEGLQEVSRILLIGKMTSISLDNNRIQFSLGLSYSQKYENDVKALLRSKISYAFEEMKLKLDRVEVSGFEPDLPSASALRIRFVAYGGYKTNAKAMQQYKPWDTDETENFGNALKKHINEEGLMLHGLSIQLDKKFVHALSSMPPTEEVPTTTPTVCTCAEVYFIQSMLAIKSDDDAQHIYDMYEQIFQSANFDQFHLRVGMTVLHPSDNVEISGVGELLPHDILSGLKYEMKSRMEASDPGESEDNEKLWEAIEVLLDTRFFTDNLKDRKKLLVVTTSFVFGPGAATNVEQLQKVKDRGIKVVYSGYSWDQEFLEDNNYPEQYASKPVINFSKKVKSLGDTGELADFYNAVMRKYICGTTLGICDAAKNDSDVEARPTIGPEVAGSYLYGIPNGTGLLDYEIRGGLTYKGEKLKTTASFRKTEPDEQQAFYTNYECGKQTITPTLRSSRIVGGTEAVAHSWPWIVSFNQITTETDPYTNEIEYTKNRWVCGGTIIDSIWVVTAAHCFAHGDERKYTTDYQIVTGLHDQKVLKSMKGEVYNIRRIIYHPFYSDAQNKYDIALVQTHKRITFKREVSPACLPNPDVVPRIGKSCIIAGWGYTSNTGKTDRSLLKQAGQLVEDPKKCQKVYRSISYDPNINFCSKRMKSAVAMQCRGDSGGPLVCYENSKWVLYGVANFGPAKCENGGEGVYSLVPTMMEWMCCYIKSKIGPCAYTRCNKLMMW